MFEYKPRETTQTQEKEPEKVTLPALRKQLNDLLVARDAGFLIPQPMIDLVEEQIRIRRNVHSLWRCSSKRCGKLYESFVPVKSIGCGCGYYYHQIWTNSQWQR